MGMFDRIKCEYPLPGIAEPQKIEFQTKDLECWLDNYQITPEGRLMVEVYRTEDRSDKTAPPGSIESIVGIATKVHEGWKDTGYHGWLRFYGHLQDQSHEPAEWLDFKAKFTDGQLVAVERLTPHPQKTADNEI